MDLPADDFMLLSYVNTALRDGYSSLEDFAAAVDADVTEIETRLARIGYVYDPTANAFR